MNDWSRFKQVYEQVRKKHWNPSSVYFVSIYDLRKVDHGIDYVLRRLLKSEYKDKIRLFDSPTSAFGRNPFKDLNSKVCEFIRKEGEKK